MSHLTEPLVSRDGGEQVPKPWHHYSWNVRLGIAWTAVEFASRTVRGGDIVSVLLFQQTGSHAAVGYVQGVNGIMQLAVALPAGFLADRHRRDRTLALGALLGLLAGSLQLLALVRYPGSALWLGAAMAALGAYSGWTAGPLEAIFADSTSAADRQRLFTAKYVALTLACAAGPLVGLAGFVLLGNRWTTQKCVIVLVAGLALMLPSLVMLLMFNDDATLVAQERRQGQAAPARDTRAGQGCPNEVYGARMAEVIDVCPEPCSLCFGVARHPAAVAAMKPEGLVEASRPLVGAGDGEAVSVRGDAPTQLGVDGQGRSASPSLAGERDEERGVRGAVWEAPAHVGAMNGRGHEPGPSGSPPLLALWGDEERGAWQGPRSLVVPGLILASDVLGALAAGMTVRFVVLFMTERYDMRPITVSLLGALGPGVVALFSWLSGPVARVAGALEVNLWWRVVDIVLMLAMAAMPERPGAAAVALGVVHVVRMGAANCSRPLLRAILMDNVPPEKRALWSAADNVRTFSWSGSAALGGLLIAAIGYRGTFIVTSAIKVLSMVPLALLLPVASRAALARDASAAASRAATSG